MTCPYCNNPAELVGGERLYPHREDLHNRLFWFCAPCDAYIGARKDGGSMGSMANFETREARIRARSAMESLGMRRNEAMRAILLEMRWPEVPISRMSAEDCAEFILAVKRIKG